MKRAIALLMFCVSGVTAAPGFHLDTASLTIPTGTRPEAVQRITELRTGVELNMHVLSFITSGVKQFPTPGTGLTLLMTVNADGRVAASRMVTSSMANWEIESKVVGSSLRWKFSPATTLKDPVTVMFRLQYGKAAAGASPVRHVSSLLTPDSVSSPAPVKDLQHTAPASSSRNYRARRRATTGGVFIALGIGSAVLGTVSYLIGSVAEDSYIERSQTTLKTIGIAGWGIGGVSAAVGATILISAARRPGSSVSRHSLRAVMQAPSRSAP